MTAATSPWRHGVVVVRAGAIEQAKPAQDLLRRATAFDFTGAGGARTWIGSLTYRPGANTGPHIHGRHEVAVYVVRGTAEIRWGERLEFAAQVGPGDFVYFAPFAPHQERNLSATDPFELVVVRSDNERIAVALDIVAAEKPETVY